jgi:hypothetical protein
MKKQKGMLRMFCNNQWSALHTAARHSSAKICEILIDNGCNVNGITLLNNTPLILSSERTDEEAWEVVKLLIFRGADLAKKNEDGDTALHRACLNESDDVVQALVDSEADVNAQNNKGQTALMLAAQNLLFGENIIPILIQGGADVTLKDKRGVTALNYAYGGGGGKMLKALAPFVPEGCKDLENRAPVCSPDPIGSMAEGLQFGFSPQKPYFDLIVQRKHPAHCWSMLRNGKFDITMIFQALSDSDNMDLWCYSLTELWQRGLALDVFTGETILHLAVKCKNYRRKTKSKSSNIL